MTTDKNYRFEIDAPYGVSIIVRTSDVASAREDAYTLLNTIYGRIARIKTANEDVKVMRRMPVKIEGIAHCWRYNDAGVKEFWAWIVYA